VLFLASASLPNAGLFDRGQIGDTTLYRHYGRELLDGHLPYRDYYMEYPPGALPVFVAPALVGSDGGYATRFKLVALGLGIGTVIAVAVTLALIGASTGRLFAATALVGIAPALLGPVVLVNYDFWPAFLATAAIAALVARRETLAFTALALGVAAKLFPAVILPVALVFVARRRGRRAAYAGGGVFAGALAAVMLPFFVLAPGGFVNDLSAVVRRPLQIESLGSSVLLAAHQLGAYTARVTTEFNSQTLDGLLPDTVALLISIVMVAALVVVWVAFARGSAGSEDLFTASAAAVTAAVALGKVLSPQFLVWLVPLVALVGGRTRLAAYPLLVAALALTQVWFPSRYGDLVALEPVSWVVLARDLMLVALLVALLRRISSA
jgi:uncharacterized membrane protein